MSGRVKWLTVIAYGGMSISGVAFLLWLTGAGTAGLSHSGDTWEAYEARNQLLEALLEFPLLIGVLASVAALLVRRQTGENGKTAAGIALILGIALVGFLVWFFIHLGIR